MNKLSLFSGIGGDDLASEWAGIETVCFVERDKYCQKVLKKNWPEIPIIEDVKDVTKEKVIRYASELHVNASHDKREKGGTQIPEPGNTNSSVNIQGGGIGIDIIAGGFPCQPHSVAGKRKGSGDERNLWPEFRRIIGEIKPRWVVAENVPGLFSSDAGRFFGEVLADLAALGYSVGWCTYGAVDVGAWHRRNRVFIVAYSPQWQNHGRGRGDLDNKAAGREGIDPAVITGSQDVPNAAESGLERAKSAGEVCAGGLPAKRGDVSDTQSPIWRRSNGEDNTGWGNQETEGQNITVRGAEYRQSESRLGGVVDGLSYWMDEPNGIPRVFTGIKNRVNRLKGLGNAVVPQQIYPIYKAIVEIENAH